MRIFSILVILTKKQKTKNETNQTLLCNVKQVGDFFKFL